MALFLSTYVNKVDKKGRVSVPVNFRNSLVEQKFQGIIVYNSFINNCIEACSIDRIEQISISIDELEPFSEERDAFATTILGGSTPLPFDSDGRIILPEELLNKANIKEKAIFVGKGTTFEIWNESDFAEYSQKARDLAHKQRLNLSLKPKQV